MQSTSLVAYVIHAVRLNGSVRYIRRCIGSGLSLKAFLPTKFEASVQGHAGSHFKNNSVHYWFTSSDESFPEAALTPLKRHNLRCLKMCFIHDTVSYLLAPIHLSREKLSRPSKVEISYCPVSKHSSHIARKSQKQKTYPSSNVNPACAHAGTDVLRPRRWFETSSLTSFWLSPN